MNPLEPVALDVILKKCHKEDSLEADPLLYIEAELESIKCHWCLSFKGSTEPRVVNQLVKSSKSHSKLRQLLCAAGGSNEETTCVMDIRNYFHSGCDS